MKNTTETPISNRGFNAQFLCIAPLAQPLVTDRVVTSIDAVRIKYTYPRTIVNPSTYERFDTINYLLEQLTSLGRWMDGKYDTRMLESGFHMGNYRYTVHYTLPDDNSFAVLLGRFNTAEKSEGQAFDPARRITYDVIVDFNPNKIPTDIWQEIAGILSPLALQTTIQRFDLAMDFSISRHDLQLIQRSGSVHKRWTDPKGVITEYIGERQHHGAIKLYDKGADLGHPELNVSRCEITIDPKRFKSVKGMFPTITTTAPVALSIDFSELPFPVQAVILHPDLYELCKSSVHPNTWRKYKNMIADYGETTLTLTDDQFSKIDTYVHKRLSSFIHAGMFNPVV